MLRPWRPIRGQVRRCGRLRRRGGRVGAGAEGEEVEWPSAAFFEQQEEFDEEEEVPIVEEDVDVLTL